MVPISMSQIEGKICSGVILLSGVNILYEIKMSRKRKRKEEEADDTKECVIHTLWTPDSDHFTFFSNLKDPGGRLEYLQTVKAQRLSPDVVRAEQRMEDICNQLPVVLTEGMVYHK